MKMNSLGALAPWCLAGCLAAGLAGCGSNQALLARRGQDESRQLQDYCKRAGVSGEEIKQADNLMAASSKHLQDGDEAPAQSEAELAGTLYRLALAKRELALTQNQVDEIKKGLAKDKDQLQTYQQILEEMKTVRKP